MHCSVSTLLLAAFRLYMQFCKLFPGNERSLITRVSYGHYFTNLNHKICGLLWSLNNGFGTCLETMPVFHENWYWCYGRMKISFVFRSLVTANGLSGASTQKRREQELHKTMAWLFVGINFSCDSNLGHVLCSGFTSDECWWFVTLHVSSEASPCTEIL